MIVALPTVPFRRAATILEVLLFIAAFAIVSSALVPLLLSSAENRVLQQTMSLVEQNGALALQSIEYHVQNAQRILSPAAQTTAPVLTLRMGSGAYDPTIIGTLSGAVVIIHRTTKQTITSPDVTVSEFAIRNTSASATQSSFAVSFRVSRAVPFLDHRVYSRVFSTAFTLFPKTGAAACACSVISCAAGGTYQWEICGGAGCQQASTALDCDDPAGSCCTDGVCADIAQSACMSGGGAFFALGGCTVPTTCSAVSTTSAVYCCDENTHACSPSTVDAEDCVSGIFAYAPQDCMDSCTVCGDGYKSPAEECDDGNLVSGDGCSELCMVDSIPPPASSSGPAVCGNGTTEIGEQCDDSNTTSGDGCSATCQTEYYCCNASTGLCPTRTVPGSCVSGIYNASQLTCGTSCVLCGDQQVDTGEQCDNDPAPPTSGDGCSATCTTETLCGNGIIDAGEVCDGEPGCAVDCLSMTVEADMCPNWEEGVASCENHPGPTPDPWGDDYCTDGLDCGWWDCNWLCPSAEMDFDSCIYAYTCACDLGGASQDVTSYIDCYNDRRENYPSETPAESYAACNSNCVL